MHPSKKEENKQRMPSRPISPSPSHTPPLRSRSRSPPQVLEVDSSEDSPNSESSEDTSILLESPSGRLRSITDYKRITEYESYNREVSQLKRRLNLLQVASTSELERSGQLGLKLFDLYSRMADPHLRRLIVHAVSVRPSPAEEQISSSSFSYTSQPSVPVEEEQLSSHPFEYSSSSSSYPPTTYSAATPSSSPEPSLPISSSLRLTSSSLFDFRSGSHASTIVHDGHSDTNSPVMNTRRGSDSVESISIVSLVPSPPGTPPPTLKTDDP